MDGFKVEVAGEEVTLATADANINFLQTTAIEELLGILTNPTIALFLISIGGLAIVYEIANPGGYMSGVIGVICLVIGLYALGQLPVNYAGLALILLALALFGAEFFVHSHGALTTGGVVAFIIGALILFNTDEFTYQLPWPSIVGIPAAIALILAFAVRKAWQARRAKPVTGQEGLLGSIGTVKVALEPQGSVFIWGERWQATSANGQSIPAGERVRVTAIDGLHLKVEKVA
jgi:membrane-bound serine protease (ClpP class)